MRSSTKAHDAVHPFTQQVEPILSNRCFECHSQAHKIKGGLALDSSSGLLKGGEGGAVVVPGDPESSRLITAIRHGDKEFQMPPDSKLTDAEIQVLVDWISDGVPDPRPKMEPMAENSRADDWEAIYRERLTWWSLQPLVLIAPPAVADDTWLCTAAFSPVHPPLKNAR